MNLVDRSQAPWGAAATSYAYRSMGLLSGVTRPNGVNTPYTYDTASRLTSVNGIQYALDANGNGFHTASALPLIIEVLRDRGFELFERLVHDALGDRLLALFHDAVDELAEKLVLVHGVGGEKPFRGLVVAWHACVSPVRFSKGAEM